MEAVAKESKQVMEQIAKSLGYNSVFDFARIEIRNKVLQKIAYYQSRVDYYEHKYGMNFEIFRNRVVNQDDPVLSQFGIIEKEDDDMEWEAAVMFIKGFHIDLNELV